MEGRGLIGNRSDCSSTCMFAIEQSHNVPHVSYLVLGICDWLLLFFLPIELLSLFRIKKNFGSNISASQHLLVWLKRFWSIRPGVEFML